MQWNFTWSQELIFQSLGIPNASHNQHLAKVKTTQESLAFVHKIVHITCFVYTVKCPLQNNFY